MQKERHFQNVFETFHSFRGIFHILNKITFKFNIFHIFYFYIDDHMENISLAKNVHIFS